MDFSPLFISIQVSLAATVMTVISGTVCATLVAGMKRGKGIADGIFTLPLILPPTVVGFFLLVFFGKNGPAGQLIGCFGGSFVFTRTAAVISSAIVSFPLMYRTVRGALEAFDRDLIHAARTLGMSECKIFLKIIIPGVLPGMMAGCVLSFARALGEFGATIMIAGNIPGKTQTMAVAVYTAVQSGDRDLAFKWVLVIFAFSFASIIAVNMFGRTRRAARNGGGSIRHDA